MNKQVREYVEGVIVALVLGLIVRAFVFTAYQIPTPSMEPTLKSGDFILIYRLPYGVSLSPKWQIKWGHPERGEVIVFSGENSIRHVKRVFGTPGDRIELRGGALWTNGVQNKFYLKGGTPKDDKTVTPFLVPPGYVFLLGDGEEGGDQMQQENLVPLDRVLGTALLTWFSLERGESGSTVRWERVFSSID